MLLLLLLLLLQHGGSLSLSVRFLKGLESKLDTFIRSRRDVERDFPTEWKRVTELRDEMQAGAALEAGNGDRLAWDVETLQEEVQALDVFHFSLGQRLNGLLDPFVDEKLSRIAEARELIDAVSTRLIDIVDDDDVLQSIETALLLSVLSTGPDPITFEGAAKRKRNAFFECIAASRDRIESDAAALEAAVAHLAGIRARASTTSTRMDLVCGEPGASLVCDLLLTHALLSLGLCDNVVIHCSSFPVGLTGCTMLDVVGHIEHLADPKLGNDAWAVRHLGEALRLHVTSERIRLEADEHWGLARLPLFSRDMPQPLRDRLASSACILVKGQRGRELGQGDAALPALVVTRGAADESGPAVFYSKKSEGESG